MNDETMDEMASETIYRGIVACLMCGDFVPGLTVAEAAEDAHRLGWQRIAPTGSWRCADCFIEEAAL